MRERVRSRWMFAALNTVEPPILELVTAKIFEADKPWSEARLPLAQKDRVRERLKQLSARLGDAGVARRCVQRGRPDAWCRCCSGCKATRACSTNPRTLAAYVARGEARPAYKRAFAAHSWR